MNDHLTVDAVLRCHYDALQSHMKEALRQRDSAQSAAKQWFDTAVMRSILLQECREFVLAYIKQCDVSCGVDGARELLDRIGDHIAEVQDGPQ